MGPVPYSYILTVMPLLMQDDLEDREEQDEEGRKERNEVQNLRTQLHEAERKLAELQEGKTLLFNNFHINVSLLGQYIV